MIYVICVLAGIVIGLIGGLLIIKDRLPKKSGGGGSLSPDQLSKIRAILEHINEGEDIIEEIKDSVQYHYKLENGVLSVSGNETFPEDQTLNYSYTFNGDDRLELDGIDTLSETLNRVK